MISYSSLIRQRLIMSIMLLLISIAAALFILALNSTVVNASSINRSITLPSPTASSTKPNSPQANNGIEPNLIYTLIGVAGAILGVLIREINSNRMVKKTYIINKKFKDKETKEIEKIRSKREIEENKTIELLIQNYRTNLPKDRDIAHLQILGMNKIISVTSIYVRLRLNKDTRITKSLDRELIEAQASHDTEKLIRLNQVHLEQQFNKSLDPASAISMYKHCVIVGDPGSGKTTLLKYLTIKSANNDLNGLPDLPISIELKEFANSDFNDLLSFILDKWSKKYGFPEDTSKDYLKGQLKQGHVLVLLDGLDETFVSKKANEADETANKKLNEADETYRRVLNTIQNFRQDYHQSPIVVTVRKAKYQQEQGVAFRDFTELEVLDFRMADIQQFVVSWFIDDPKQARDLNNKIRHNLHVQALAANPLLLSLITLNYEENPTLPQRRAGIYKECIDTLITKWDKERKVNRPRNLTPEHLKLLLEVVAWHFHMQRQHYFPKEELLRVISDVLPAIHISRDQKIQILEEITSTYGLLFKQAEEWYGFLHLTFQEYFVSLHIANEDLSSTLLQRIEDPWWEEAILLSAGASKDASPLLQNLLQKNSKTPLNEDIFHTHLILAGRCLAASFRVDEISLQEDIINRLFGTLMQASYSLTRQQIASTLIEMNKTAVNKRIIELLNNQEIERDIHFTLLDAIAKSTNLSISSALLPLLSDIQITKEMRQRIAITLGQQRNPSVTDELLQLILKPDIDTDIRASIIYSLGMSEEEHIVDKLSDLFTHYPDDWELHIQVIDTISKSGKSSSASRLRSQLPEQNLNQDVRIHIIDALGLLKDLSCIPELLKLLIDASILLEERLCIVNNLSILGKGDASTLNYLHQAYKETQGTTIIHQCIAITLARLDDHSTSDDLLKIIPDPMVHLAIRQMAAIALVKLTDVSIIQQLLKICFDAPMDTIIQKCILDTIGMLDDRSLVPMLIPLISNSNIEPEVRSHIVYALEMLGKQLPISELLPLLSDVNVNTQILQLIIDKLEENDDSSLISELLPLLPSQNIAKNVRKSIANTIGKFANDETTAQALTELLYSSDIKDDIYSTLWKVSHQARVRISIIDGPSGKVPNIHKW